MVIIAIDLFNPTYCISCSILLKLIGRDLFLDYSKFQEYRIVILITRVISISVIIFNVQVSSQHCHQNTSMFEMDRSTVSICH